MYKKLLISAGGGIIARDQQAEQNEAATIAIGLGGTGISCLRALKKEVYTRIKPDDAKALSPTYRHIKFLAIDTDKKAIGDDGSVDSIDGNTEFLDLSCADIAALLTGAAILKNKPSLQWLKAAVTQDDGVGIEIQSAEAGAGGVRQIGRLLLLQNCNKFVQKLGGLITEARRELGTGAEVNIHIFTGLGGGTGAGTFLDVCYLTQYVLGNLGLHGVAQTCGYFFMPDVNIDKVSNSKVQEYIKSNGFAAMKELDYCMNFDINGGEWNQIYDGFTVTTKNPPVKLAHLITATDEMGVISDNAYDYAMHVAVDYVMDFLVKPVVPEGVTENPFTIKSHISNIRNLINMTDKEHGACYNYCVLGASNAYLPYREITTYLTSKIFEGFGNLNHQSPSEDAIDLFIQNLGLKYENISKELQKNVASVPLFEVDTKTIYEQTIGITKDTVPQVLTQMRNVAVTRIPGQLVENKKAMLEELEDISGDANKSIVSMITKVKKQAIQIAAQADKGPYYAAAILHNVKARDLQNKIDGYIEQNSRALSAARGDLTLRDERWAKALRELQNSGAIGRKRKGQEYVSAVHSYYTQTATIERLSVLNDVLTEFKKQVNRLYEGYFAIFRTVLHNLEATFSENLTALATPALDVSGYAVKLMTIQDLQESLDASVKAMRIEDLISGFVSHMLSNQDIWVAQDESKIAHAVSEYFLGQLTEFTGKTITDYLKIKFQTEDPQALLNHVYNQIIMPLSQKAAPLFWRDASKYTVPVDSELGFCTIPEISSEIKGAVAKYTVAHKTVTSRPSLASDRISFLIFKCGIPMYGYKGCDNYRGAKRVIGAHLYEGASGDDRDWRTLYDITPYSCRNNPEEVLVKKAELVEKAFELGVLVRKELSADSGFDYVIKRFDAAKIESQCQAIETVIKTNDANKAKTVQEAISNEAVPVIGEKTIKNIGAKLCEDTVVKDLIISSDGLLELLSEETGLLAKREEALRSVDEFIKGQNAGRENIQVFAAALCTGVIKAENDYTYVYEKENYGLIEKIELTTINSQPYGEYLMLYSAYVGYVNLDDDIKAEITAAIRNKKVNCKAEVEIAKAEAREMIAPEKINAMMQRAQMSFAADVKDISMFLTTLSAEIKNS